MNLSHEIFSCNILKIWIQAHKSVDPIVQMTARQYRAGAVMLNLSFTGSYAVAAAAGSLLSLSCTHILSSSGDWAQSVRTLHVRNSDSSGSGGGGGSGGSGGGCGGGSSRSSQAAHDSFRWESWAEERQTPKHCCTTITRPDYEKGLNESVVNA